MKTTLLLPLLTATASVESSTLPTTNTSLQPRQQRALCDLYAYWSGHGYELLNNLWGKDSATSGSQCTYLDNASADNIQWSTTWTWEGGPNNVKSYPYVGRQVAKGRTIASVSKMPTSVTWRYDNEDIRANVAYDVFTAEDPGHVNSSGDYELMIWLARYGGVWPIGSSMGTVTLAGYTWELWTGYNGAMRVYSFVPPAGQVIRSFSADVKEFYNYLEKSHQFPASRQNIIVYQIGTEAFTGGPATFTCTKFSADVI
ncbi:concanavalin A-like lectin/glucanase domain-containing protein [Cercophora newfieldiana]|uniref:Concanavalin A-like lectin/glucanase domain-containing protein n=1 Tax=Cercophora newfieldiana TaxID=92897 RepID=A0AA40CSI9_9PEZI|nr:concanavalin A-like lectin/glucanase domain-containing protein [Cercophora newfieldiana]